jgi:hypothetical protein
LFAEKYECLEEIVNLIFCNNAIGNEWRGEKSNLWGKLGKKIKFFYEGNLNLLLLKFMIEARKR